MCEISVITPVYNAKQEELERAIRSILNQTFDDFEFIIINDGSTNNVEDVVLSFDDKRIIYLKNEENLKITKTLNKGLKIAKGKYIARLDSDDYSLPKRLKVQYEYLEKHNNIGLLGSNITTLPDNIPRKIPTETKDIKYIQRYITNCFCHSAIMMRKEVLDKHNLRYNENCLHAEDYKLWCDISYFADITNLEEHLTYYTMSEDGICANNKEYQNKMINFIKFACIIHDFETNKSNMRTLLMKFAKNEEFTNKEYEQTLTLLGKAEKQLASLLNKENYKRYIKEKRIYNILNFINFKLN